MPAYNWQTDPFGYMGDNSPNFIAAGQPEYARGELNNEASRIQQGGAPTYNPILAQGFNTTPVYDINKGQSYGEFLARETARTQAGADSGPYTNNPTLKWNFLNQNSTAIPNAPFRLPTYQDPTGINYPIRAGTTALPSWAVNATPNWQQLIGGGAAGWGNPGAPTYQAGQNIFQAPTAASNRIPGSSALNPLGEQEVNPNPVPEEINRADPVMLPPYEVVDYKTRTYEPDQTDMTDLDRFYQTGNPITQNPTITPEGTPEQIASDKMTDEIMRRAQTRINNASKVGPVSEADKNRIFQEEAEYIVRTQAAVNAPQRILDLSPSAGSTSASSGQIPWVIPISGISPTQAILATILLNQIAGRSGGGAGYGGGTAASASGSTTNTGTTSTGGDAAAAAGAVIGTGTGTPTQTGTQTGTQTQTETEKTGTGVVPSPFDPNTQGPGAGIYPGGVTGTPNEEKTGVGVVPYDPNKQGPGAGIYEGGVTGTAVDNRPWTILPGPDWVKEPVKDDKGAVVPTGVTPTTSVPSTSVPSNTPIITSTPSNPVTQNTTASLRNLLGEGSTTADALSKILPDIYRLYGQGAGSLAQSDLERLAGITGGDIFGNQNRNLTQLAAEQTAAANRALREGNLQDAQDLARQAETLKRQVNPELYDAMRRQQEVATGQVTSDLERLQQAQARQLSPEDVRNAQQAAREAYSARGLVMGPGAIGAEILNRENLARQREQEARTNLQTSLGNLNQTVGFRTANIFDPLAATLSQQYGMQTGNQGLNQALFNQAAGISSGGYGYNYAQNLVNPFTPYTQDLYGTNVNALNAASIANANRAAALEAAKLGQSGTYAQALGSFLGTPTGGNIIRDALKALGIG